MLIMYISFLLKDDSIVQAMPRQGLIPPSQFMKKPQPVNAIKLEDLEKQLTGDTSPQRVPEGPTQTPRKSFLGQPPPGIPRPMMTPPGLTPPRARMVSIYCCTLYYSPATWQPQASNTFSHKIGPTVGILLLACCSLSTPLISFRKGFFLYQAVNNYKFIYHSYNECCTWINNCMVLFGGLVPGVSRGIYCGSP